MFRNHKSFLFPAVAASQEHLDSSLLASCVCVLLCINTCSIMRRIFLCWLFSMSSRWWIFSFRTDTSFSSSAHLQSDMRRQILFIQARNNSLLQQTQLWKYSEDRIQAYLVSLSVPSSLFAFICSSSASPTAIFSFRRPLSITMFPSSFCSSSTCWFFSSDCRSAACSRSDCSVRRRRYSFDSACRENHGEEFDFMWEHMVSLLKAGLGPQRSFMVSVRLKLWWFLWRWHPECISECSQKQPQQTHWRPLIDKHLPTFSSCFVTFS